MSTPGARRVVTTDSTRAPRRWWNLDRFRHWRRNLGPAVGGILAAAQAAIITFLTITVPAIATYVATSGNPDIAETHWWDALHVGTDVWLLGHGGTTSLDGAIVSVIPLGIALLALLAISGTFRRTVAPTAAAWATATIAYPLGLVLLGSLFASPAGRAGLWRAGLGALLLALIAVTSGFFRHEAGPKWDEFRPSWIDRIPGAIYSALRGGALALCVLLIAAGFLTAYWIFQGQREIGDVLVGLGGDWISILVLGIAQILLAPNLVLWTFSWLTGAGFTVGEGTLWSPEVVAAGPLPALPILGALPQPDAFLPGNWVYLVAVVAGIVAVIPTARRHPRLDWYWSIAAGGIIAIVASVGAFFISALSAGSLGPGRMEHIGPHASQVMVHLFLPLLASGVLAALATGKHARDAWALVRSKFDPDGAAPGPRAAPGSTHPKSRKADQTDSKSDPYSTAASGRPQTPPRTAPGPKP